MRVYLCAGDKTEKVANYLLNNRKSSMDIEGQAAILECLDILAARGMIYDKLVIIGYTFDQFTQDEANRVFDNLRALASSFNETQEIVIFGTHENSELDLEKLYFRHLAPFKCVRWEGSGKIKMADIESIIIGSRSIEVGSPITQGMKETKIQKTAPIKDNPGLKRSGVEPAAKRGLFGRKKPKKQDAKPETPKGPIRGSADDLKKLEEVSLDPTAVSPVGQPVQPAAAGRVMSLKEKRELAERMAQQRPVPPVVPPVPPVQGSGITGAPGGFGDPSGAQAGNTLLYDNVKLGGRQPEVKGSTEQEIQGGGVFNGPPGGVVPGGPGSYEGPRYAGGPGGVPGVSSHHTDGVGSVPLDASIPLQNQMQHPEVPQGSGQPGSKMYGGPERIEEPEMQFQVNLMDPNLEKPRDDLDGPSGYAPLQPGTGQGQTPTGGQADARPIGHGPNDFAPRKVRPDVQYPDGAPEPGGFGYDGPADDEVGQYGPLRGGQSGGTAGVTGRTPVGSNVSFQDTGVDADQGMDGFTGPTGTSGGVAGAVGARQGAQSGVQPGQLGVHPDLSKPGTQGKPGTAQQGSAQGHPQGAGVAGVAPNGQAPQGAPAGQVPPNGQMLQGVPQGQPTTPQPKKGFLSAITGGLGRKKKQSGMASNAAGVQQMEPGVGVPPTGVTPQGQQMAPAFQGQQVGAAVESYGKSKGKTKLVGNFPDLAKCDEMRRRTHAFYITGDRRCGKSGTAANLGMIGAAGGLHTLVIDMDLRGRGLSLYFPQEMNTEDNLYTASLSNALRSPHMMRDYVWKINPLLDVLGLDLSIDDISVHEKMITPEKIEVLVGEAKSEYELVIVDFPFDMLIKHAKVMTQCDRLAFVTENDICSMINIINLIAPSTFSSAVDYHMFRSKLGFILNRYNANHTLNESIIAPNYFTLMLNNLVEEGQWGKYPIYGTVEEINTYSKQLDNGSLLCSSKGFDEIFFEMLYCMYK